MIYGRNGVNGPTYSDEYYHTAFATSITLLSAGAVSPSCRIGSSGGGTGMPGVQRMFELPVQDSLDYSINVSENQYMDNLWAFRSINSNSNIVSSTYTGTVKNTFRLYNHVLKTVGQSACNPTVIPIQIHYPG
jgi:hypothetical protein